MMPQNPYNTKIDNQIALDFAIRDALNEYSCGYDTPGKATYYNYMSKEATRYLFLLHRIGHSVDNYTKFHRVLH